MNPRLKTILEQAVVIAATLVLVPVNVILWAAVWYMRWVYLRALPLLAFVVVIQLLRDWNEHRKRIERIEEMEQRYGWRPGLYRPRFKPFDLD